MLNLTGRLTDINPELFYEEVSAALGRRVIVEVRRESGVLHEAVIRREDGQDFTAAEIDTIHALADAHDPQALSTAQAESQARQAALTEARARLDGFDPAALTSSIDIAADLAQVRDVLKTVADLLADLRLVTGSAGKGG